MVDRCRNCDKPVATEADWEATPEGEGEHLCWGWGTPSCASVDWRARALAAEAERDALRELRAVRDAAVELVAAERERAEVSYAQRTQSLDDIAAEDRMVAAINRVLKARRALGALVPRGPDTVPTEVAANNAGVSRG